MKRTEEGQKCWNRNYLPQERERALSFMVIDFSIEIAK